MAAEDHIPELADADLARLHANVLKVQAAGGKQLIAAEALLPHIEAEIADRLSRKPPPKKPAAKKKAVAKKAVPVEVEEDAEEVTEVDA